MRDPKRIPEIIKRLKKLWMKNPDMRLAQLIGNVYPCTPYTRIDAYHIEDEEYIKTMEEFYGTNPTYRVGGKKDLKKIISKFEESSK